jgi:uncharacterized membrane protein YkvA (DUF1232 family)
MKDRLRRWAEVLERDTLTIWLAARDPRVPWYVKGLALCIAAYALSPIDLIPDFIPVIGYLDDLLIVPLGIYFVLKLTPTTVVEELRATAARRIADRPPPSMAGAAAIIAVWVAIAALVAYAIFS